MSDDPPQNSSVARREFFSELPAPRPPLPASSRWGIYLLFIAIAVGNMTGRLLNVNSVDAILREGARIKERLDAKGKELEEQGVSGEEFTSQMAVEDARLRKELKMQRPFLSANDRSRWMTIRALVEQGKYEIDGIVGQPTWDTIDMVKHVGRDGEAHLYSSKPPLLATILAGEYWLINRFSGATLSDHPYEIGRLMLFTANILPMILMYVIIGKLVERFGTTDWGRIFVMACATLATFLNTFAVVLNNHIIAAVSTALTVYLLVRVAYDGERRWFPVFLAGVAAAFTVANELPAAILLATSGGLLLLRAPRETLIAFVPGVAVVAAAFFGTNWIAHARFSPPYAFRSDTDPKENWYFYTYTVNGVEKQSYWLNRQGLDRGEESRLTYGINCLVGHHGIFSLSPIWLLSLVGTLMWLARGDTARRELAALVFVITVVCLVFFIGTRPLEDRNYGGMTSGLRWFFWCAPLWLLVMIPAADRLARSFSGQALAAVLLSFSVLSISYPTWNPWVQPWLYNWMQWCGLLGA